MTKPFPDGFDMGDKFFENTRYDGIIKHEWWCTFVYDQPHWKCVYVYDEQPVIDLFGVGDTPREAFESLVSRFTIANGGVDSPVLRNSLFKFRAAFDDEGMIEKFIQEQWERERPSA